MRGYIREPRKADFSIFGFLKVHVGFNLGDLFLKQLYTTTVLVSNLGDRNLIVSFLAMHINSEMEEQCDI